MLAFLLLGKIMDIDPEKLANSGVSYVLSVVAIVMVLGFRQVITYYRSDSKEWQSKLEECINKTKDFSTALEMLKNEIRELRESLKEKK
jgi:hypothetical protein